MRFQTFPLQWKITLFSTGIVIFSLLLAGLIYLGNLTQVKEQELGERAMITSRTIAELPEIRNLLASEHPGMKVQEIVEPIRMINKMDYVVVYTMNKERLSHPVPERIGTFLTGDQDDKAFAEHIYITKARGEMGVAVKAFVPVKNDQLEQIGVVVSGKILPTPYDLFLEQKKQFITIFLLAFLFGLFGSWLLARHIKKQLFRLEPHQIARMLTERIATFDAIHEGVIAIDNKERITVFNEAARKMLGVNYDPIGKGIREVLPDTRLPEVLEKETAFFQHQFHIGSTLILSTRVPIYLEGKIIGALAVFSDRTEVTRLAEELTGVKEYVEALRVQAHEHKNTLHTIAGLIQLQQYDKALEYLLHVHELKEETSQLLTEKIQIPSLSGLILSKINRGKELGITVRIDPHSRITSLPEEMEPTDLVVIVGNLVENCFEALTNTKKENKSILIYMEEMEDELLIVVEDNGPGIPSEIQEKIFEKGVTTNNPEKRGLGLFLVKQIVDRVGGSIEVESSPNTGTVFTLHIPRKKGRWKGVKKKGD